MKDTPERRLAHVLRERRELSKGLRQGVITPDQYTIAFRELVKNARLYEPNLARLWWADDLGWLMRAIAQATYSGLLLEGDHVVFGHRMSYKFRPCSFDECQVLAVHLKSALPILTPHGFGLSLDEINRALSANSIAVSRVVVGMNVLVYFRAVRGRRTALVLDWLKVQELGTDPRRGDPRGL